MDDLARNVDAMKLAERLHGIKKADIWVHVEAEGPLEKYPAKQHARRVRDRLDVAKGLIYLPGAPARLNEDSDMPAPFRQRRYFYYLSGCNEASCHLTYDIKRDILSLFIPRVNPDRVFWNGRGSTPAEALDKYDIDEVFYTDQLEPWIQDWFLHYRYDGAQRLYVVHKEQGPHLRFPLPVDYTSLQPAMNLCRMIKDEHEIKLIKKANDISSKAHKYILANITKFSNEAQVEGLFLNVCISNQAKQQAYDPIAASGPNAGTLHYDANNEDFGDRQLMCLDAGCEFDLYASDITRTFPLSGSWPSKEAENIYKLVERMQEECIKKLAPGVRYLDLHILAHQIAIDGLLKLGILHNGTREEIYKAGTSKAFFPHGLGHHIGLEVHDVGQRELMSLYKHPKYEKVPSLYPEDFHLPVYDKDLCMSPTHPESPHLEEGMVVTVEPGIYFSAYVLNYFYLPSPVHSKYINTEVLYRYFPVGGVRIEDDLLITSKGYENLTTAPKGDAMFAIIRNQATPSISRPKEKRDETVEEPLRRAPGIPKRAAEQILKPITRAATEPTRPSARSSPDEKSAFQIHWLFRESQGRVPPTGSDDKELSRTTKGPALTTPVKEQLPLCGIPSLETEHIFMGWQGGSKQRTLSPNPITGVTKTAKPKCQHCLVLSETVDRLRKTLSGSMRASPSTSPGPESSHFEPQGDVRRSLENTRVAGPSPNKPRVSPMKRAPKMEQVSRISPNREANELQAIERTGRSYVEPVMIRPEQMSTYHEGYGKSQIQNLYVHDSGSVGRTIPEAQSKTFNLPEPAPSIYQRGAENEPRSRMQNKMAHMPEIRPQRRSVTFDTYPTTYPPQLSARHDELDGAPYLDTRCFNSKPALPLSQDHRTVHSQRMHFASLPHERRTAELRSSQQDPPAKHANFDIPSPGHYYASPAYLPDPSLPPGLRETTARIPGSRESRVCSDLHSAVVTRPAERDHHTASTEYLRNSEARPSLPTPHHGPADENRYRDESAALRRLIAPVVPRTQEQRFLVRMMQEHDLKRRRSTGSAPRSRMEADNSLRERLQQNYASQFDLVTGRPHTQNYIAQHRSEGTIKMGSAMYRPGGEELRGIDYPER